MQQEKINNPQLWMPFALFFVFVGLAAACFPDRSGSLTQTVIGVTFILFALLSVGIGLMFPTSFTFSAEKLEIRYLFGIREEIPWETVTEIEKNGAWLTSSTPPCYYVIYTKTRKTPFFACGEVARCRKTTRAFRKYCPQQDL